MISDRFANELLTLTLVTRICRVNQVGLNNPNLLITKKETRDYSSVGEKQFPIDHEVFHKDANRLLSRGEERLPSSKKVPGELRGAVGRL